jgi:hypothetical protein
VKEIAWKAQHRLHKRYRTLSAAGKEKQRVITAVGGELLGPIRRGSQQYIGVSTLLTGIILNPAPLLAA